MPDGRREVIFTLTPSGSFMEARAIDVDTGIEAVTMGPLHAARADLERLAGQKLRYILERQGIIPPQGEDVPPPRPGGGRGIVA